VLLYAVTRHALIFSSAPPPPQDMGFDTFGWKDFPGPGFWGTKTTIVGPLGDPTIRRKDRRDFLGRRTPRPSSRNSDEAHFAEPDVITVKTTAEIRSGQIPNYADSDFSAIELEDKSERMRSHSHED
jgi:hypothetical protein